MRFLEVFKDERTDTDHRVGMGDIVDPRVVAIVPEDETGIFTAICLDTTHVGKAAKIANVDPEILDALEAGDQSRLDEVVRHSTVNPQVLVMGKDCIASIIFYIETRRDPFALHDPTNSLDIDPGWAMMEFGPRFSTPQLPSLQEA